MPAVLRIGAYRFFFYSNENAEPAHIHVRSADGEAKFWLNPIKLEWSQGYNERELRQIERLVAANLDILTKAWTEFFGKNMTTDDVMPNDLNRPVKVEISDNMLRVTLADGRIIATPLDWYPRLMSATSEQLLAYELSPAGIHWDELDEDLSVAGMLQGIHRGDRKVKA